MDKESNKKNKNPRPVVLDTITTRFLMLFIIVLVIPLFSLITFTNSILKNNIDNTIEITLSARRASFQAKLKKKHHAYARILQHFSKQGSRDITNLCSPSSEEACFLIDFKSKKVFLPNHSSLSTQELLQKIPDFEKLKKLERRELSFYSLWKDQLFSFNAYQTDSDTEQWYVLGSPINNNLLSEYYRENPAFTTGLWIIQEPFSSQSVQWHARGSKETSQFSSEIETELLEKLKKEKQYKTQTLIQAQNQSFQVTQDFIYNLSNEKIGRIITILPLVIKDEVIAAYSLGIYLIVIASILFSITVAILASRSITQPMLRLVDQVSSLGKSDGITKRVTVKGVHEINTLGKAFNKMLDKLEQEHQIKDDFVATLTHDLKVPLLSEKQTLHYLKKGTYGPLAESQTEVMDVLQSSNQSNLDLVNGILEIYRYESGQIKLVHEAVAIDSLLKSTLDELRPLAREKNIKISTENATLWAGKALIWADRLETKRVLTNLISNAITNTPKHGEISCRLTDSSVWGSEYIYKISDFQYTSLKRPQFLTDRIAITIQDSGIGFSTEDLPRLFKQFVANRGRNPMSIGLGLYNCYQVVKEHGGAIWVETTEGEGSAVTILLPIHAQASEDRRHEGERRRN